jgi:hypothetical protein
VSLELLQEVAEPAVLADDAITPAHGLLLEIAVLVEVIDQELLDQRGQGAMVGASSVLRGSLQGRLHAKIYLSCLDALFGHVKTLA